jgi:hypothetical protein
MLKEVEATPAPQLDQGEISRLRGRIEQLEKELGTANDRAVVAERKAQEEADKYKRYTDFFKGLEALLKTVRG